MRTRDELLSALDALVHPLRGRFTQGRCGIALSGCQAHYGAAVGRLEAFARPLWGILPALRGGARIDIGSWQEGFLSGTDPRHPEYWGRHADEDQRMVETPVLALCFALLDEFWTPYSDEQRGQIAAWLSQACQARPVDNNWRFFRILTHRALSLRGLATAHAHLEEDLARIDSFYLGDGWYADGLGRRGDYYVAMAFHFYGLIYAELAPADDPWRPVFVERASRFAADFEGWFDRDGAGAPFGRSLTYRFAQGALWGMLAQAGVEALPWGRIKGYWLRHLRWWLRQPILNGDGTLSVGYAYPNPAMGEQYNAPGSPYWAFKAFAPLALDGSHPFWAATEVPARADALVAPLPHAGLIATAPQGRAQAVLVNAGQPVGGYPRHAAHKYSKFAYASALGFCVPLGPRLHECGPDSMLCLSEDGERFRHRETCEHAAIAGAVAYSRWAPWPDVVVESWLLARCDCHVRVHRLRTRRTLTAVEAGFPIGYADPAGLSRQSGAGRSEVSSAAGRSVIASLWPRREGDTVILEPGSSLMTPLAAVPVLRSELQVGEHWLACAVAGCPTGKAPLPAIALAIEAEGPVLRVDGEAEWRPRTPGEQGDKPSNRP